MIIFADTSNIDEIKELDKNNFIGGFTTNPTLMKKAGIKDYEKFCKDVLSVTNKPVSFEVFADEFEEMERQARITSSWAENIYVKIPVMNTRGKSSITLVNKLLSDGIKINITAVLKHNQVVGLGNTETSHIISIFAGRIADTGVDPCSEIFEMKMRAYAKTKVLWASPREVLNIYQAEREGADIITVTPELIKKYFAMKNKDLIQLSLETVQMFYTDAQESGFTL